MGPIRWRWTRDLNASAGSQSGGGLWSALSYSYSPRRQSMNTGQAIERVLEAVADLDIDGVAARVQEALQAGADC